MTMHCGLVLTIGKLITNLGICRKIQVRPNPLTEKVHHGEVGILLGLSKLIKKSKPATAGVFSGLGEALAQTGPRQQRKWSSFKKKEKKTNLETSMSEQERNDNVKENNHLDGNSGTAE